MTKSSRFLVFTPLFLLFVFGFGLIYYLTEAGIGTVNDSVGYVAGARNILVGQGYSRLTGNGSAVPISNFPPMLSIALAGLLSIDNDVFSLARYFNATLFALTILLVFLMAKKVSESNLFSFIAALFVTVSAPVFVLYTNLMSEPLYFVCSLAAIWLILCWADQPKLFLLIVAGLLTAAAMLTRYVGITVFAVSLLVILQANANRLKSVMLYALFALLPFAAWLGRNLLAGENAANRQLTYHPIPAEKIKTGLNNLFGWLLPERGDLIGRLQPCLFWIFFVFVGVMAFSLLVLLAKKSKDSLTLARTTNLAYALLYLTVLYLSLTFVDASSIFDHRLLSPFYLQLILLSTWPLAWISGKGVLGKALALLVVAGLLVSFAGDAREAVRILRAEGQGYANSRWVESPTIATVRQLPAATLYTNRTQALYLLADKPAYAITSPINPATGQPRDGFLQEIIEIWKQVRAGQAFVIFFDYKTALSDPEEKGWVVRLTKDLPVYKQFDDGIIYGVVP